MNETLTPEQVVDYHRDGYVIARGMFDTEEIDLLHSCAVADRELDERSFGRADGEGRRRGHRWRELERPRRELERPTSAGVGAQSAGSKYLQSSPSLPGAFTPEVTRPATSTATGCPTSFVLLRIMRRATQPGDQS
jgi:hypothetical protein